MINSENSNLKIAKGATIILIANIINMLISIITNFILPKNLSTDTYASIKLYQLYLSYVGILHFGAVDGIYLRYGGKKLKSLNENEIKESLSTFRIFQFLIVLIGCIVSILSNDLILLVVSLMVLPTNMLSYYKYLFQACGEFSAYSRILNFASIGIFVVNMGLVLIVKSDYYIPYLLGYLFVNTIILLYTEFAFSKKFHIRFSIYSRINVQILIKDISNGILLTLGNFTSILMTSMDRWFVKLLIGTTAFAQYAFAVSIEHFLNTAATPMTITFYNVFCNDDSSKRIAELRKCMMIISSLLVSSAFIVKFITEIYLSKYNNAIDVVFYLFAAQFFYVVIKSIYNNLYKVRKKQGKYFLKLSISLIIGFCLNLLGYFICNIKESYAIATLLSAVLWLIIILFDFDKSERISVKEWIYMILVSISLLILGKLLISLVAFILYICVAILFAILLLDDTVIKLFRFSYKSLVNLLSK